mgnify:CR=1 FL=1
MYQNGGRSCISGFYTDLHSMGREESCCEIKMKEEPVELDGLNYPAGQTVDFINECYG